MSWELMRTETERCPWCGTPLTIEHYNDDWGHWREHHHGDTTHFINIPYTENGRFYTLLGCSLWGTTLAYMQIELKAMQAGMTENEWIMAQFNKRVYSGRRYRLDGIG